jgi:hypothetical protein
MASGLTSAPNGTGAGTITLPAGRFTQNPNIASSCVSVGSAVAYVFIGSSSTSSFAYEFSTASGNKFISWTATQMTSGAASG